MEIRSSEATADLFAAIVSVQSHGIVVIEKHENRQVRSKYASFEDIQTAVRPKLAAEGLAYIQSVGRVEQVGPDAAQWITTRIIHKSGQWIEGSGAVLVPFISLKEGGRLNIAWASGSAISYAKRYALCAMLAILTGDDDDAEAMTRQVTSTTQVGPVKTVDLGLSGEVAEYIDGRWREVAGPDNRLLGQYSFPERKNLLMQLIKDGDDGPVAKAIIADGIIARLRSTGETLVGALEARGWEEFMDPNDWDLATWHKATFKLLEDPIKK